MNAASHTPATAPAAASRLAPDEAARLAEAFRLFNAASEELTGAYGALEKQVVSLTEELAQANGELRRQYEEKARLTDRLSTLLAQLPAGVVVVDRDGYVEQANPAAQRMLPLQEAGWAEAGWQGRGQDWGRISAGLEPADSSGEWISAGLRLAMSEAELAGGDARIVLLHDVTRQHALKLAAARNERLAAMGEMAASLAHQLRTPLAAAMLYTGTLASRDMAVADIKNTASKALERLRHLERLIRDTLLFARGEVLGRSRFSIADLIGELAHTVEPVARACGVEFSCVAQPACTHMEGDRKALLSALVSLIENAIQASAPVSVVSLHARREADSLVFEVADCGRGIAPALQERLFEPFFTTRDEGTGLGLAIARGVARAHGGDIEYQARDGGGSLFRLRLPQQYEEQA